MATTPVSIFRGSPLLGASPTTYYITNKQQTSTTVATMTTSSTTTFSVGQIVTVVGVDSTYDGTYVVCAVGGTSGSYTFSFAKAGTAGSLTAVSPNGIAKVYGGTPSGQTVTNKVVQNYIATLTTSSAHGFVVGDLVNVNIGDAIYDGFQIQVYAVPTTTTFCYVVSTQTSATTAVTASTAAAGKYPALYTVGASTTLALTNIVVHNPTTTAQTFSLLLDGVVVPQATQIAAGATQYIDLKQVLATTKTVVGTASSPYITFNIAGVTIA